MASSISSENKQKVEQKEVIKETKKQKGVQWSLKAKKEEERYY